MYFLLIVKWHDIADVLFYYNSPPIFPVCLLEIYIYNDFERFKNQSKINALNEFQEIKLIMLLSLCNVGKRKIQSAFISKQCFKYSSKYFYHKKVAMGIIGLYTGLYFVVKGVAWAFSGKKDITEPVPVAAASVESSGDLVSIEDEGFSSWIEQPGSIDKWVASVSA